MVCTRPDLAFAVGRLSRHLNAHAEPHHAAVLQVLRYVKGTMHLKITYSKHVLPADVFGYSDSDFAGDLFTRRSTTAYIFQLAAGAISWKSRLQPTVAKDSVEAEYMAISAAASEAIALKNIGSEFGRDKAKSILIYCDSTGAIARATGNMNFQRVKHIDIHHHFIKERVESGELTTKYINTTLNPADALTKALTKIQLFRHRDFVMGVSRMNM